MTLRAEVPPRRDCRQGLLVAIGVVGDADHRRLRAGTIGPAMAGQAFVGILVDMIPTDTVWNGRRLFRIVALAPGILVFLVVQFRWGEFLSNGPAWTATVRGWCIQRVVGFGCDGQSEHREQGQRQ